MPLPEVAFVSYAMPLMTTCVPDNRVSPGWGFSSMTTMPCGALTHATGVVVAGTAVGVDVAWAKAVALDMASAPRTTIRDRTNRATAGTSLGGSTCLAPMYPFDL